MSRGFFLLLAATLLAASGAAAEVQTSATLRVLGSYGETTPSEGGLNPDNAVFHLPQRTGDFQARLDLRLSAGRFMLFARPRFSWTRQEWDDPRGETDSSTKTMLLEGGAKVSLTDRLFASYARENLQWGPSQLKSPSNPFFPRNGRENPIREIPGSDFLRLIWLPDSAWTVSLIANTCRGEATPGYAAWRPSQALKVDYVGEEASGSLLYHDGSGLGPSIGGFGQKTVSEALLVYGEFLAARGNRLPYPVADQGPAGGHLALTKTQGERLATVIAGASYTLLAGPTLSFEYLHDGSGFDSRDASLFHRMAGRIAGLAQAGLIDPSAASGRPVSPSRRNYLFCQYLQSEVLNKGTLLARLTFNADDGGSLLNLYADWALGDHLTLFAYGAAFMGSRRDEFGLAVRNSAVLGVEVSAF